jgi:hypothetical protein
MDPPELRFLQMENDTEAAPSLSPAMMNSSIPDDMTEAPVDPASNSTAPAETPTESETNTTAPAESESNTTAPMKSPSAPVKAPSAPVKAPSAPAQSPTSDSNTYAATHSWMIATVTMTSIAILRNLN